MARKGSITVFLALILSLLLSLVCTSIESVRMAAARTQILNGLDIGLYSLFGQYDRSLLRDYDLFFLDGSCGGGKLKMARVYDNMESYIKPVLKQNSQKLSIEQGGFTGYRLATDENGEVFYHQVVRYMKDTLGSQGVHLLLEKIKGEGEKLKQAEEEGTKAEERKTLESYDSEMDTAAKQSQAALEAQENAEKEAGEGGAEIVGEDNGSENNFSDGQPPAEVVNPITVIRRIREMGILELVIPPGKGVSENEITRDSLASGRGLQQGMKMADSVKSDDSYTSQILFQQYLMDKLGNYQEPAQNGLRYQIEYLLQGKNNDRENLKAIASKLLLIREGINLAHLLADSAKRMQAESLALAVASTFLIPPASVVIEGALLLCWAFAESILDVRELFDGGKVPLVKSAGDWQVSLENLPYLLESLDSIRRGAEQGMSYRDYLQAMLLTENKDRKVKRGMDMIEASIRTQEGRENFQLDSCVEALEAAVDVRANRKKVFTVTKQYCYN